MKQARGGESREDSWDSRTRPEPEDMARAVGDNRKASAHAQSTIFCMPGWWSPLGKALFGGLANLSGVSGRVSWVCACKGGGLVWIKSN